MVCRFLRLFVLFVSRSSGDYAQSIGGVETLIFAVEVTLLFTNFHLPRKFREILILGPRTASLVHELLRQFVCAVVRDKMSSVYQIKAMQEGEQKIYYCYQYLLQDRCRPSSWCFRSNTRQINPR